MSKRKGQDNNNTKEAKEIASSYLTSFDGVIRVNNLEKILNLKELPQCDPYPFASMLQQMNTVFCRTIAGNIDIPDKDEMWLNTRLKTVKNMLLNRLCHDYRELRLYQLQGEHAKWNMCSLIFHICSSIFVILGEDALDPMDEKYLASLNLLVLPEKKIPSYTQTEITLAICTLASRWTSLHYHPSLSIFLDHLHCRVAYLCVGRYVADVMDGKDGRDRFHSSSQKPRNPNDKLSRKEFSCTPDYIGDVASMITVMRISLYMRTLATDQILELQEGYKWEKCDPSVLEAGFNVWLKKEVDTMDGQKFKEDLRTQIMIMCALRPGDYEKYMRDNAGRTATDAAVVIEHCMTPLQASWWTAESLRGGMPKLICDPNPSVRNVSVLKVFHHACTSRAQFNWWIHCFVSESDLVQKMDNLCRQSAPAVIKQMGEYNLFYRDKIYRTRTAVRAIIMWTVTMVYHFDCMFKDARCVIQKLDFLRTILRDWNKGTLPGDEEDAHMPDAFSLDDLMDEEVFCEVLDPLFIQS